MYNLYHVYGYACVCAASRAKRDFVKTTKHGRKLISKQNGRLHLNFKASYLLMLNRYLKDRARSV